MVLPEGTPPPERDRPRTPTVAVVGIALLALLAATFALGQATSPPEQVVVGSTSTTEIAQVVAPTTTTTIDIESFSADDIATGGRFFWIKAPPSGRLWPIDLVEHDGSVYLFGSQEITSSGSRRGASMWISSNGVGWEPVGEVIPETNTVRNVVSTEWGLLALGQSSLGAPTVWTSTDGRVFSASTLPSDDSLPGTSFELNDAVVADGRLLVVGVQVPDRTSEVLAALPESLVGTDSESVRLGFDLRGDVDDGIVDIHGPLGLHAFSLRMGELGLDDDLEAVLVGPDPPVRQFIWSTENGVEWEVDEVGASIVQRLWLRPNGDLVAYGEGGRGSTILTSEDGRNWEAHGRSSRAWIFEISAMAAWRGMLVGGGLGEDLFVTSDGLSWERLGTGELLPDSINWRMGPVGTGESGLVTVARALRANNPPVFTPVVIESGDATLTLDLEDARLLVDRPGYERLEVFLWTRNNLGHYEVDFLQETVTFVDPDSGDALATVGFATLEKAESSAFVVDQTSERALLFTPDADNWSVQSLSNVVAETHEVESIVLLEDRVLLLTYDTAGLGASIPPQVSIVIGQIDP
jgi:hypothetical protein